MTFPRLIIVALLSCTLCQAAEISAWKIPLNKLLPQELKTEGITRCEKPPEASVFFNKGDELWDLSTVIGQTRLATDPAPEWAIWNATSKRIVTKSDLNGFMQLYYHYDSLQLPTQIRLSIKVVPVSEANGNPQADEKSLLETSVLCRSGEIIKVAWGDASTKADFEIATTTESATRISIRIDGTIHTSDQDPLHINSHILLNQSETKCAARDFDGKKGLDVIASAQEELLDKTPITQAVLIENDKKATSYFMNPASTTRERVGNQWLLSIPFTSDGLYGIYFPDPNHPDPFAAPELRPEDQLENFKTATVPDAIKAWFPRPIIDMRDYMMGTGITVGKNDFAGYDPLAHKIIFLSGDETQLDMVESLFMALCMSAPPEIEVTWSGSGESVLVMQSGENASLSRQNKDGTKKRSFYIEATLGENRNLINLAYKMSSSGDPNNQMKLSGNSTVHDDKWSKILTNADSSGKESVHRIRARITSPE